MSKTNVFLGAAMIEHAITYRRDGIGAMGWMQPACSCGWEGVKHYAYNDYQHADAHDEASRHVRLAAIAVRNEAMKKLGAKEDTK